MTYERRGLQSNISCIFLSKCYLESTNSPGFIFFMNSSFLIERQNNKFVCSAFVSHNNRFSYAHEGWFYMRQAKTFSFSENVSTFFSELENNDIETVLCQIGGGAFSLVIYDNIFDQIYLVSDRYSLVPLYYNIAPNKLEFSFSLSDWKHYSTDNIAQKEFIAYGALLFSDSFSQHVTRVKPHSYLKISNRFSLQEYSYRKNHQALQKICLSSIDEINLLDQLFLNYFSKAKDGCAVAGLSGGFDSRLILAYLDRAKINSISTLTMGGPRSDETIYAQMVANILNISHVTLEVPTNILAKYGKQAINHFRLNASLELVHVYFLYLSTAKISATLENPMYFDGFLGDVVMGGSYYSGAARNISAAAQDLLTPFKTNKLRSLDYYASISLEASQRIDLTAVGQSFFPSSFWDELANRSYGRLAELYPLARHHEDMIHLMRLNQRGYRWIMNGPRSLFPACPVYLPFMDYAVRDLLDSISIEKLARHSFYRSFIRTIFPELGKVPKAYCGANAFSSDFSYRIHQYTSGFLRHKVYPRLFTLTRGLVDLKPEYISLQNYSSDPENIEWLKSIYQTEFPSSDLSKTFSLPYLLQLRLITLRLHGMNVELVE